MNTKREFWQRNVVAVVGMLVFSAGINLFIVPANLYNFSAYELNSVEVQKSASNVRLWRKASHKNKLYL